MTRSRHASRRGRRGFSLLEVIVVLSILGVVAGVTAPALRDAMRKDELTSSADEIIALIDRTRRTAVEYGAVTTLTIDATSKAYWVTSRTTLGERLVGSGTVPLAPGAELVTSDGRATFTFDPEGKASVTDVAVRLIGKTTAITVDRWRGEARLATR